MSLCIDSTQKSAWYVISTMHGLAVNIIGITLLRSSCRGHWLDQPGGARRGLRRENQQTWPLILTLPSRTGVSVSLSPPYQSTTHWGGLNHRSVFSHNSRRQKSKITVLYYQGCFFWGLCPWLIYGHLLPVNSQVLPSLCICVRIPSSYEDTSHID